MVNRRFAQVAKTLGSLQMRVLIAAQHTIQNMPRLLEISYQGAYAFIFIILLFLMAAAFIRPRMEP